ncbi:MAG TPA: Sua5 family C-terminal domain-containing protein, partial [Burkholderiaceae bacterium]
LAAHYAPRTPLELVASSDLAGRISALRARGAKLAVMSRAAPRAPIAHWEPAEQDPRAYARALYRSLRRLDAAGADRILVEAVHDTGPWAAIADRLARAQATFEEAP